jgi:hypothetical protein
MPRAYLRIDPNLDETHPDLDGFIRLLCAAARQPERGRFKDRALVDRAVGRAKATKAIARGDVVTLPDGRLYVDGWDEWQEGDITVGERMRRMRAKRRAKRNGVTPPPSPERNGVTTDAETIKASGVGLIPHTPAQRGLRANGTNPRALADMVEAAAKAEREERRRASQALHQRYLRGDLTEAQYQQAVADLRKEPDDLTFGVVQ